MSVPAVVIKVLKAVPKLLKNQEIVKKLGKALVARLRRETGSPTPEEQPSDSRPRNMR